MKMGKPISQVRAEGAAKRQRILNCRAYREGERFCTSEAARVIKCDSKAVYHILDSMIDAGVLQSHRGKNGAMEYSKPGIKWARISWRRHSNESLGIDQVLLDEALGI